MTPFWRGFLDGLSGGPLRRWLGRITWIGALNFVVLQWFGVRLARVTVTEWAAPRVVGFEPGRVTLGRTFEQRERWLLLRWVMPLTGWWSDFRWIARRS